MDAVNHIELTIPPSQVKPILRALLDAIFFHRVLDTFEPETWELAGSHIAAIPSNSIEKEITAKIEEFVQEYLMTNAASGEFTQLAVVFLQRKAKKGWFAVTEELVPWEEHLITIRFNRDRQRARTPPADPLPGALLQLITFCTAHNGNVPPLTGAPETTNLSHQILIGPPSPTELFSPSPPVHPTRLTSPPPQASLTTTPATAIARDQTLPLSSAVAEVSSASGGGPGSPSPGHGGITPYLEQAKDGLRAVGARAGAVTGWGQRGGLGRGS